VRFSGGLVDTRRFMIRLFLLTVTECFYHLTEQVGALTHVRQHFFTGSFLTECGCQLLGGSLGVYC